MTSIIEAESEYNISGVASENVTIARMSGKVKDGIATVEFVIDLASDKGIYDTLLTWNIEPVGLVYYMHLLDGMNFNYVNGAYAQNKKVVASHALPAGRYAASATFLIK